MNEVEVKCTIVFKWNDDAIHARNEDGTRKYRYIINEGSSRSSKTRSLIQAIHKYCQQHAGKRCSVWRATKTDCSATVGDDVHKIFPALPLANTVRYNATEDYYTFHNGSEFEINGTDNAEKVHGYNGHVIWLNEPYSISRATFDQLDMRAEDFVVIDWNPKQSHWIDDLKKDPRTIIIKSTFRNNPYCPPEQKRKILSYQPVKMCDVVLSKIMIESEAKAYDLIANTLNLSDKQIKELSRCKENERKSSANAFNWSVYGLGEKSEKPNRIFFWDKIKDDEYHKLDHQRWYGIDWGVVDPFGILEAKYYDGALYFHQKNYKSENEIKEGMSVMQIEEINKAEEGLVKWLLRELNIPKDCYLICDNNRPMKILALHDIGYEFSLPAPKPPGSIIDGIDILRDMKCYYTESSLNLEYEQENYERQVDRYGIVMDEPVDKDNHLMDPARYIALYLKLIGILK